MALQPRSPIWFSLSESEESASNPPALSALQKWTHSWEEEGESGVR